MVRNFIRLLFSRSGNICLKRGGKTVSLRGMTGIGTKSLASYTRLSKAQFRQNPDMENGMGTKTHFSQEVI